MKKMKPIQWRTRREQMFWWLCLRWSLPAYADRKDIVDFSYRVAVFCVSVKMKPDVSPATQFHHSHSLALDSTGQRREGFRLKSTTMSCVFVTFRWGRVLSHQAMKSPKTGPWSVSLPYRRLTRIESSADFKMCVLACWLRQSSVQRINSRGDRHTPEVTL